MWGVNGLHHLSFPVGSNSIAISMVDWLVWLVGWFTPPLPWDGGMARTAIQAHAINLIELG